MKRLSAALAALALVTLPQIAGGATPDHVIPAPQTAAQCAPLEPCSACSRIDMASGCSGGGRPATV